MSLWPGCQRNGWVSAEAHVRAIEVTRVGGWEYEIEAEATHTMLQHGAEGAGYPAIVGSGPNSNVWHYQASDRQLQDGDIIVMDYGADMGYLTMDITRTWPASGEFTELQERAYRCVLEAEKAVLAAMRPGVTRRETRAIAEEVFQRWGFTDQFPGGAGHFVATLAAIRERCPGVTTEVLVPDFTGRALEQVLAARPEVFNHNLETVARLFPIVRPRADYRRSLEILRRSSQAGLTTKSGIIGRLDLSRTHASGYNNETYIIGTKGTIHVGRFAGYPGPIPVELRKPIGNRIFGCDDCQFFCPWNKFAQLTREDDFKPRHELDTADLVTLFAWDEHQWSAYTQGSALRRAGYDGWLRNIAVALGNAPSAPEVTAALTRRADHPSLLVREHVEWALAQHEDQ